MEDFQIKIFSKTFKVIESANDFEIGSNYGDINYVGQIISIRNSLTDEQRMEVLLHEVLHAIDADIIRPRLTENQIEQLSVGLFTFLRDNPDLIRQLLVSTNHHERDKTIKEVLNEL